MKICIASDLHADMGHDNNIKWPDSDVLVIAGDTANSIGDAAKVFKRAAKIHTGHIVTVDGNHEHYSNRNQDRTLAETRVKLLRQLPDNAVLLGAQEPWFVKDGVAFIGCNGWYTGDFFDKQGFDNEFWKRYMNDHHWAFSKDPDTHPLDLAWIAHQHLDKQIQEAIDQNLKIVVVTHTAPHRDCCRQKVHDMQWQMANGFYFNSHNEKLLSKYGSKISLWIHGHVHDRFEKTIDGVRIIANPRGYPRELPSWEPLVLEL